MATRGRSAVLIALVLISLSAVHSVLAQQRGVRSQSPFGLPQNPLLAQDDVEERVLAVIRRMTDDPNLRYLSVSLEDGRLLRQLTETAAAKRVVEIGTLTGYSGLWFALALRATGGKLITHELDPDRARMAEQHFKEAGVDDLVTVIVGDAHETVKQHQEAIDILFLDADTNGYIDYLNQLLPLVRPGGLVIAHNVRRPTPDPRYIEAVTTNPKLDTSFLLMEGTGVSVTLKKR